MSIQLIITDAGRAALVNAQHNGTNAVTIAQVGVSGTPIVASPATANLPGEVKRIGTLSGSAIAADTMHVIVRDETADVFTVRSIALYLSDGTLFGAYGQVGVIAEKSAQAMLLLAIDVIFADINAAQITFGNANFLNPPATTQTAGVARFSTDAEAVAFANVLATLTPRQIGLAMSAATILSRLMTVDGSGSGIDADLLDGRQAAEFALLQGANFTAPISVAGPVSSIGATAGFIAIDRTNASSWVLFADANAFNFYTGGLTLLSLTTAGLFRRQGSTIWDAGNDGAGTGLDADLLDGQQGAYYTDIVGRLGYTPLNATSYSAADVLAKLITVDGAGSALDADLLDGQQGSYYTNIAARLGYTPLNSTSYSATDVLAKLLTVDGAGSGIDADLLDGRQAAEFALLQGANFTAPISVAGPVSSTGATAGFIAIDRTNASSWVLFADANAFNFYTGGLTLLSLTTAGLFRRQGSTIWDAGNDGAGTGLDADLLDGQQGAYYTDIAARLGYTPLNAASYTAADVLAKLITVDGAGSNLDADLLDGQQGTYYTNIAARLGYTPLNSTSYTAADVLAKLLTVDGSGSGVDADLLDGKHAADFLLLTDATRFGSNANGFWEKRPNGVIEQWGTLDANYTEGQIVINFPIAFTDVNSISITANAVNSASSDKYDISIQRVSRTVNGCVVFAQYSAAASSINQINGVDWRAIGR